MAEFTIIHRIEAPELTVAIKFLADAIKARSGDSTPNTVSPKTVVPTKVDNSSEQPAISPVSEEIPTAPFPAPAQNAEAVAAGSVNTSPVPTQPAGLSENVSTAKAYTFEDITAAGSQLLEQGKMNQLMTLLKEYGVQAVTQLKPEQYADVAAGLRKLGAKI